MAAGGQRNGPGILGEAAGCGCGPARFLPAAERLQGFGAVAQDPAGAVLEAVAGGEFDALLADLDGFAGAADAFQGGREVDVAAGDDGEVAAVDGEAEAGTEVVEARVDLPGVHPQPRQGQPGVELGLFVAHQLGQFHGALGRREAAGTRVVQDRPAGDGGKHLGVHGRRRQAAHQLLSGAQVLPAVAAAGALAEPGALHQEPRRTKRIASPRSDRRARLTIVKARSLSPESRAATAISASRSRKRRASPSWQPQAGYASA